MRKAFPTVTENLMKKNKKDFLSSWRHRRFLLGMFLKNIKREF